MRKLISFLVVLVFSTTMLGVLNAKDISIGYVLVGPSNDG